MWLQLQTSKDRGQLHQETAFPLICDHYISCHKSEAMVKGSHIMSIISAVLFKIPFVLDIDKFTLEHQVFLHQCCTKCDSTKKSQRKFKRKFPEIQVPNKNIVQNLVNKVRTDMNKNINVKH